MKDDRIPRFDPETGAPIRMDAPEYGQPRFDPETGAPIQRRGVHPQYETEADEYEQPRFDPETGAPIQRRGVHPQYETEADEYEQPRFDPETGAPIQRRGVHPQYETEPVEYGQPRFDPETGAPIQQRGVHPQYETEADEYEQPRFDPETGAPLYRDEKVHTGRRGDRNGIDLSDSFEQPEKPEKKNNGVFIALMCVLTVILLAGIGVILYFVFFDKPKRTEALNPEPTETVQTAWPDSIVDAWTVTEVETDGRTQDAADMGLNARFSFRTDGTVDISLPGNEQTTTGRYSVSGNNVTVTAGGDAVPGSYDPRTDTIVLGMSEPHMKLKLTRSSKANPSGSTPSVPVVTPGQSAEVQPDASADPGPGIDSGSSADSKQDKDPDPTPDTPEPVSFPFPKDGVPESRVSEEAGTRTSYSYSCYSLTHRIDETNLSDEVSFTLDEQRPDDTYRSNMVMQFLFDPTANTWSMTSCNQTVPEPISAAASTFSFGGVEIDCGTTEIDGSKLGINGSGSYYRQISKEDVEALVKQCPDLTKLQLDHCYLETYEPLSKLKKLRVLDLKECGTKSGRGEQITDIGWIAPLTNLRELRLNSNAISDVTPLADLNNLTLLNLADNLIDDTALDTIATLNKLEYLNLYVNNISYLDALTVLENLIYLNIHETNLKSIDFLKNMKSVTWIYVGEDYNKNPLPQFDWYNVLRACPKIQKVYVREKDTYAANQIKRLFEDGYIKEMKTY